MLGPFFVDDNTVDAATEVLHLHHNFGLVMLSIGMAFVSCCASMYMAHTNRETSALNHRRVSLLCASMVLGLGIWVMHFVGMLALQTPMPVTYDVTLTSLSILPGMVAASMALWSLQHDNPSNTRIFISGCLVGVGIATMHYSGLSAMQLDGLIFFDIAPFLASIVSGLGFAVLAFFLHRSIYARGLQSLRWIWRLAPPLCMTVAIASMHYLSMHALHIMVSNDRLIQTDHSHYAIDNAQTMSVLLVVVCLVVFSLLGLANALLRYRDLWQAVAARDARLNAMLDTSADGIITIDAQGIVTDYNPAAENIFGYSKEEVIGRNVSMLMPSPLAQQHDGHLHKHLGKPERPIAVNGREVLGKHKEGRHLPLQLSVGKANTTSGTVFIGYLQDISSRKRTDAQLRIAASVFQHVREGVAIVDANHNISDVNPAFLRLLELSREECIGKTLEMT
jgi:PAS domain S-box-containing protein